MNKNMLLNDVCMDTQTAFFMNGDININPCSYEQDKTPITSESKASYRGRITVMENGNTNVRAYRIGVMPPVYTVIFSTEFCPYINGKPLFLSFRGAERRRISCASTFMSPRFFLPTVV